jgi:crotonobetainyl-CoA:carnitine CoA-transferase CaiB-like acyl-CoA transferase
MQDEPPMSNDTNRVPGPLSGMRVVDLSRFVAGPYCAMLLGDMGAEVIKIEPPGQGELARQAQPQVNGQSLYSFVVNRNKQSLTLDLRSEAGRSVLRQLISKADVLVENFRPGTMEDIGFDWEEVHRLNPRLVMTRISGFGQDGPMAQRQCFDGVAQAMSGLMDLTGPPDGPPVMMGAFICDYATGMYAAMGTLAALNARHATGRGQVVDASLLDSATSFLMTAIPTQLIFGETLRRNGNRDRFSAPVTTLEAGDGRHVLLVAGDDNMFPRLARAIGRSELCQDPRFSTMAYRVAHAEQIETIVSEWMAGKAADDIVSILQTEGVPCAKVATLDEVVENPQLKHREQIVEIEYAGHKVPMQGVTIRLSDTPLSIRRAMPDVGQHRSEVLQQWLGYSEERVQELIEQRVI